MDLNKDQQTSFGQHLRNIFPVNSTLGTLLRHLKLDWNELLWAVKPDWPQIGESPEIGQLRLLVRDSIEPKLDPHGKRILIFSMRSWRVHKVWEGLIGRGLLERGANPTVVICDGLPRCDMFQLRAPGYSSVHCRTCSLYTRHIFDLFGLPVQNISTFLEQSDRDQARELVGTFSGDYRAFVAEGLPLGELVRPSLMRTLLRGSLEEDPRTVQLYREYLEGGILLARMFRRMLQGLLPDTLIMLNGMFFAERIGMAIAEEHQLHTVTHERGFMRNRLVLANDEPANWFRVDDTWESVRDRPLTAIEESDLDEYLRSRQTGTKEVVNYWPSIEERQDFIINQLKLDPQKPILTAFTNILWDTAVYQRDVAFRGMFEWLDHTIRQVSTMLELQLVIRIHPAEVRLRQKTRECVVDRLAEMYSTLPGNVVIVVPESNISSYVLIDLSTAVSVYTSTIGLEAALQGVPVLVSGETHYRGKGFTYDIQSPEHYSVILKDLLSWQRSSAEAMSLARRYAYLFFLRNMLPLDLVTEFDNGSVRFNFGSFDDLKPGQNEILDHICMSILNHRSFALI